MRFDANQAPAAKQWSRRFVALALSCGLMLAGLGGLNARAADPAQPKAFSRGDVGVQLFGWNWTSIARQCSTVLGPAGFDWVQTMPPQDHITGSAWWIHYQPTSYDLESKFGTRDQFAAMVAECNRAGVNVITDAVVNHMAGGSGTSFNGVGYGGLAYSDLYTLGDFHEGLAKTDPRFCDTDISDWDGVPERFNCRFPGLPDLATEKSSVQREIARYLNAQLALGVAGFRIDAAKHIPPADIAAIKKLLTKPDALLIQEVPGSTAQAAEYLATGKVWAWDSYQKAVSMFSYPGAAYRGGVFDSVDVPDYPPSESAYTWVTNHDTEHHGGAITYANGPAYELANIWILGERYGSPMLYSGYAFANDNDGPPMKNGNYAADAVCAADGGKVKPSRSTYRAGQFVCPQSWKSVAGMIAWRDTVGDAPKTNLYSPKSGLRNSGVYAFGRGEAGQPGLGYLAINSRASLARLSGISTGMAPGIYCDLITGGTKPIKVAGSRCQGAQITVDAAGKLAASTLAAQSALAISVASKLR